MSVQFPTTVNSIFEGLPQSIGGVPVPYANNISTPAIGNIPITPIVDSTTTVKPNVQVTTGDNAVQSWLRSKLPNMYEGIQADASAVSDGVGDILDKGAANWDSMSFGERGGAILGGAKSIYDAYNSYKQGKLAREQFEFKKDAFNKNYAATAKTTNAALADRQATRVARDPTAYASVNDYMKKYGV